MRLAYTWLVLNTALSIGLLFALVFTGRELDALRAESMERESQVLNDLTSIARLIPPPCQCHELDQCPICEGTGSVKDEATGNLENCPECDGRGVVTKKFGAGGRIIPQVRDLTREANEAVIETRAILKKFDALFSDIESGAAGIEIDGSIMRGHAEVRLKRKL